MNNTLAVDTPELAIEELSHSDTKIVSLTITHEDITLILQQENSTLTTLRSFML
tara:strand:- start:2731 stop:2892 length:162 start_codon:yes stop_codon:yes gene_type:complete